VTTAGCPDLDAAEIQRLVELELISTPGVGKEVPPAQIELVCAVTSVTIVIRNPDWSVRIERQVPPPVGEEGGRERQLAITIAQFAAALWRTPEPSPPLSVTIEPEPAPASTAPAASQVTATYRPSPPEHQRYGIEAWGSARFRALERAAPLVTGRATLAGTGWLDPRFGILGLLAFEGGVVDRTGGEVAGYGTFAGVGLVYRLLAPRAWLSVDAVARLEGGYVWIEGRPGDDGYLGRSTRGFAGDAVLGLAPALHFGAFALSLAAEGGYGIPAVVATVRDDSEVSFGGWWVGVGLRLGVEL